MFQYAAGRALALKTGSRLILDATVCTLPKARRAYALEGYALAAETRFDGYAYPPRQSAARFPAPQRPRWAERRGQLRFRRGFLEMRVADLSGRLLAERALFQ